MSDDFEEFYVATWPRLLRATYGVAGDRATAEDALQTAFAQAYARWRSVSRADDPVAYLRRMAINAALSQRRKAYRRRESSSDSLPERPGDGREDAVLAHDVVWQAIQQLPPRQRAVVVLRYYEDMSEAEIADILGCRPGTVKSQASTALATLRGLVGDGALATEGEKS